MPSLALGRNGSKQRRIKAGATPIAKIEIYNPTSDSSYYVPVEKAKELAKRNPHKWIGCKTLVLGPDRSMKVTWAPKQSGIDGPLVMQVVA